MQSSFNLRHLIKYLPSQENVDCCTASSSLLSAEMLLGSSGKTLHFSRLYLYYMARQQRNRVGQQGTDLLSTLDALKNGVCTDRLWPLIPTRVDRPPPAVADIEARLYKLTSYEATEVSKFKEHLLMGIPIVIGLFTGRLFWKIKGPLSEQTYAPINNDDNRKSMGHATVIIGYDDGLSGGSWIIANSLGLKWGDHGIGILPYECNHEIGEAYIITDFAGITAHEKISVF